MSEEKPASVPTGITCEPAQYSAAMLQMITGYWVSQTVRAAAELSVMDHVAAGASTAEQVAARESSDARTTYRLMRACASLGLLAYEGDRRFAVTPLGDVLRADAPGSVRNLALALAGHGHWRVWEQLPEAVRAGVSQSEKVLGVPVWDYFDQVAPGEGALFGAAMADEARLVTEDVLTVVDLAGVSVAVDVGGANGALVQALLLAAPELRGVVLDRPDVVPAAVQAAEKLGVADRFTGQPGDFFQEVPAADLYLVKQVLHDWDDEACLTILRNCRAGARAGARMVVVGIVLGEVGTPDPGTLMDMNMLAGPGGQERDLSEYDALFAASGWRRVSVRPIRAGLSVLSAEAV